MAGVFWITFPLEIPADTSLGFIAKKLCPDLILIPMNFSRYSEMSDKVMAILARYDPNMCPADCDEGYLK